MSASQKKKYAGSKRSTTLSINGKLVDIATEVFRKTRHRSLSGFVDDMLVRELRARAPMLRKAGYKLPEELFWK